MNELAHLAEKMGSTTGVLWPLYVQASMSVAMAKAIWLTSLLIAVAFVWGKIYPLMKRHFQDDTVNEAILLTVTFACLSILLSTFTVASVGAICEAAVAMLDPEGFAILRIVKDVTR